MFASRDIFLLRFRRAVGRSASVDETTLRCSRSFWRPASSCRNIQLRLLAHRHREQPCQFAPAARSRRARSSDASSCTITWPSCKRSPSHAKIFSTRPPERGPTCASSTSIVPETAFPRLPQPAGKRSKVKTAVTRTNCSPRPIRHDIRRPNRSPLTNDVFTLSVPSMSARLRE